MAYADNVVEFSRKFTDLLILELPRCSNVYTDAASGGACTASGDQCWYNVNSCGAPADYSPTTREFKYQSSDQPLVSIDNVMPLLDSVSGIKSKIDPDFSLTKHARMEFLLNQDFGEYMPLQIWDHDKKLASGTRMFNTSTRGEHFTNLVARIPNYKGSKVTYKRGFVGDDESDYLQLWEGELENIEILDDGIVKITATDALIKALEKTVPIATKSSNVLTVEAATSDEDLSVVDASEYKILNHRILYFGSSGGNYTIREIEDDGTASDNIELTIGTITGIDNDEKREHLWATTSTNGLYKIDHMTGLHEYIGGSGDISSINDLCVDNDNDIIYTTTGSSLCTASITTGSGAFVAAINGDTSSVSDITYDHISNKLYGSLFTLAAPPLYFHEIYEINVTTGSASLIGTATLAASTVTIAYDKSDDDIKAITQTKLYSINKSTASATEVCTFSNGSYSNAYRMAVVPFPDNFIKIEDELSDGTDDSEFARLLYVDTTNNTIKVRRENYLGGTAKFRETGLRVNQVAPFMKRDETNQNTGQHPIKTMLEILLGYVGIARNIIDWSTFTSVYLAHTSSYLAKRLLQKPQEAEKLINQLNQLLGSNMWQVENTGLLKIKKFAPPDADDTIQTLTEDDEILTSVNVDRNTTTQITRALVYYLPIDEDADSEKAEDYQSLYLKIDSDLEDENNLNREIAFSIFNPWVYREADARRIASNRLRRYRWSPALVDFNIDPMNYDLWIGDLLDINCNKFVDNNGDNVDTRIQILTRIDERDFITIEGMETKMVLKYGLIADNAMPDYTLASASDQAKYAFIGTGIASNAAGEPQKAQMSNGADGSYQW